ncbi:dimethylarginine dimethylaminohydrolase family protein [Desulfosarcina ovata]|uniref:Hydrolase n=1 Tax=Desulfosarcina ovata subsp. ovata TaxID=2752305 RepID=A0A5K8A405_9BACT|nr:arginine deiminase family protein [Desulfosarcina ovata]BBO87177.1 hydrolase [Desulfosarcina ovata subsp. ovata]
MVFTQAITRRPGPDMAAGITTADLGLPDLEAAQIQFDAYVKTLSDCGMSVIVLDPLKGQPDAHFVEDTAVITPEVAVMTHPGASARQGEVDSVEQVLADFRKTIRIQAPGTIDGGDVLMMGNHFLIGLSDRTNPEGARQLGEIVAAYGYTWTTVTVAAGLHFKSSVNAVGEKTVLTTTTFADHPALAGLRRIIVSAAEAYAGNTLLINGHLIMPAGFPDTRHKLESLQMPVVELDTSEFRKMDGGLTCLSLRF